MKIERSQAFTYRALQDKDKKVLSILDLLTAKGVISRTEVSRATGVNVVSISNYINRLIDKNLVLETGLDVSTGGRKPELVELNAKENYVIGVDVSDVTTAILADASMGIRSKIRLEPSRGGEGLPAQISSAVETLCNKAAVARNSIKAIGIGSSAGNPDEGPGGDVRGLTAIDTFSGDRLACAAYGEKRMNASCREGALLYVSSSLGACVLIKDSGCVEPDRENGENAEWAEWVKYLRPWNASLGVAHIARQSIAKGIGTAIVECARGSMENVNEDAVIEAAAKGDEIASNILQNVGMNLGLRIAYLINIFKPETVAIGGGLEKAGERILGPVRNTVAKFSLKAKSGPIKIVPASLGADGVAAGAAWLAVREIFLRA
jgi:predicted NBD/HSP70 family sugar kinase